MNHTDADDIASDLRDELRAEEPKRNYRFYLDPRDPDYIDLEDDD